MSSSCNCLTKTPDPSYHKETCKYRNLREVAGLIQQLREGDTQLILAEPITPPEYQHTRYMKSRPVIAFISGHLNVTEAEFSEHYVGKLETAMNLGHHFVVGDARGADNFAHNMLLRVFAEEPKRVTVYHMFQSPRYTTMYPTVGGFLTDNERDEAMTVASDYDIAWSRRAGSGTQKNMDRRAAYWAGLPDNLRKLPTAQLETIAFNTRMLVARRGRENAGTQQLKSALSSLTVAKQRDVKY